MRPHCMRPQRPCPQLEQDGSKGVCDTPRQPEDKRAYAIRPDYGVCDTPLLLTLYRSYQMWYEQI